MLWSACGLMGESLCCRGSGLKERNIRGVCDLKEEDKGGGSEYKEEYSVA